jgi:hypothetical protein
MRKRGEGRGQKMLNLERRWDADDNRRKLQSRGLISDVNRTVVHMRLATAVTFLHIIKLLVKKHESTYLSNAHRYGHENFSFVRFPGFAHLSFW